MTFSILPAGRGQVAEDIRQRLCEQCISYVCNNDLVPRAPGQLEFARKRPLLISKLPFLSAWFTKLLLKPQVEKHELQSVAESYQHLGKVVKVRPDTNISRMETNNHFGKITILSDSGKAAKASIAAKIRDFVSCGAFDARRDHDMDRYMAAVSEKSEESNTG